MVATKKSPHPEGNFEREVRRGGCSSSSVADSRPPNSKEELGGFIFMCNNDTMDLERCLFGLPQRYQDLVRAIQPGLPLFLYNYSTRKLHGVYEASSNGALNIEPDAWAESKDLCRNGRPMSKYPAQVRMRLREERPPLEEDKFRPYLRHYEYSKFKLDLTNEEVKVDLSVGEAAHLLRLFAEDDNESGWQTVGMRGNKSNRSHHLPSSNTPAGRRRAGPLANGTSTNGNMVSSSVSSLNDTLNRARDKESRADSAQRWRAESDSWSGSSSAGTASFSWASHEEERTKKHYFGNGVLADVNGSALGDEKLHDSPHYKKVEHANGILEVDREAEGGHGFVDKAHCNGSGTGNTANTAAARANVKPGFVSYSAALKAGMLSSIAEASSADNQGEKESPVPACRTEGVKAVASLMTEVSEVENSVDRNKPKSPGYGASQSPKSDAHNVWISHSKLKADLALNRRGRSEEATSRQQPGAAAADEKLSLSDGDSKKPERVQAWSRPVVTPKSSVESGNDGAARFSETQRPSTQVVSDASVIQKVNMKDEAVVSAEEEHEADTSSSKPLDRKAAWQGNDAAVLRRLHDPDPAVSSSSHNGTTAGSRALTDSAKEKLAPTGKGFPVHTGEPETNPASAQVVNTQQHSHQSHWPEQFQGPVPASPVQAPKALPHFHHNKPVHEARRPQFEYQKHDRNQEDRSSQHFRKQLGGDHSQSSVMPSPRHHAAPVRVPTSPPPPQHHHPLANLGMANSPLYRERTHGRNRASIGASDGVQGASAYRPTNRSPLDGDMGIPNPASWFHPGHYAPSFPGYASLFQIPLVSPLGYQVSAPPAFPGVFELTPGVAESLHGEILEFARSATPTADVRRRAECAVECVRNGVKQLWPEAEVEVFGSFATGLCLWHSDVDVVVLDSPPLRNGPVAASVLLPLLGVLLNALRDYDWCESIKIIPARAIPVLKLRCMPPSKYGDCTSPVAIDITIGDRSATLGRGNIGSGSSSPDTSKSLSKFEMPKIVHTGPQAREYVIEKLRRFPALAPLALLLKYYLHKRSLNDVYTGGLGSFSLTLMLVFFLESAQGAWFEHMTELLRTPQPGHPSTFANVSADTLSVSSHDEADEADDNSSISSYCSTNTSASSSSNDSTGVSGESTNNSMASCQTVGGRASVVSHGGSAHGITADAQAQRVGIVEELLVSMQTVPSPMLGVLLFGFLRMFHLHDFTKVKLVLKTTVIPWGIFNENDVRFSLWIDDPLRPGSNVGAGSFNMSAVQKALLEALQILAHPAPVPAVQGTDRVGMGPGRRRPLVLLDQLLNDGMIPSSS